MYMFNSISKIETFIKVFGVISINDLTLIPFALIETSAGVVSPDSYPISARNTRLRNSSSDFRCKRTKEITDTQKYEIKKRPIK